jgi:hypothetical protein
VTLRQTYPDQQLAGRGLGFGIARLGLSFQARSLRGDRMSLPPVTEIERSALLDPDLACSRAIGCSRLRHPLPIQGRQHLWQAP